jgi:hypothetical protein
MLRKNNFYLIIFIEILFLFFILIITPTVLLKEKPGVYQTSFENVLPLDINHSYSQSIISDRDNLNSISVLLKNPSLESRDIVYIEVQNSKQETLQTLSISGQGIEDPGWLKFKFSPIISQKGDIFYLKITSNSQKDNLLYIYGDSKTKNINFKTTFTAKNMSESFKDNLNQQIINFKSRNIFQGLLYLSLIIFINIYIFKLFNY